MPFARSVLALSLAVGAAGCTSVQLPAPGPPAREVRLDAPLVATWRYDATAAFGEAPAVVVGDLVYVATRRGEVHAVRLGTGKRAGVAVLFDAIEHAPVPLSARRVLVVPASRQRPVALDLGGGTAWTAAERLAVAEPPVVESGLVRLVGYDGRERRLDLATGATVSTGPARPSPAAPGTGGARAAVRLTRPVATPFGEAVGATDGTVRMTAGGAAVWRRDLGSPVTAAPAAHGGRLYVGTQGRTFYVLDAATGAVLGTHRVGGRIKSTPLVHAGGVLVFAEPSHVYHFAPAAAR